MSALQGMISATARAAGMVARVANVAGTLTVLGLVLIVNSDVVGRGVFHAPFRGAYEVVQFSMVLIVFLQLPDVCRVDRLTRSDGLLAILGESRPGLMRGLSRFIDTLSAILMLLVAITIWPEIGDAWESQDFFGTPGIFTAPWWPVKLVIFISAALCSLVFALKAISGNRRPDQLPTAAASE